MLNKSNSIIKKEKHIYHQEDGKQESMQDCRSDECNRDDEGISYQNDFIYTRKKYQFSLIY